MSGRSFAGYSYRQPRGLGFYGEQFAAVDSAGARARILHVTARLAGRSGFAEALARFGSDLDGLDGDGIVATRKVGRALEGPLVVVTDDPGPTADLESVTRSVRGQLVPYTVALRIVTGVVTALARAHRQGIVHGGMHPRSVLVDARGRVLVDHFAVARTLASVAARDDDAELWTGFRGYLAPELALAEEPTPACDVFAAGAIMYAFFGGDLEGGAQPGRLKATTGVRRLVVRAMDTDAERRFTSAVELAAGLAEAIQTDRIELATADELALYTEDAREAGTPPPPEEPGDDGPSPAELDDLLSDLDGDDEATGVADGTPEPLVAPASDSTGLPAAAVQPLDPGAVDAMTEPVPEPDEEAGDDEPTEIAPQRRRATSTSSRVDDVLASLSDDPLTDPGARSLVDDPDTAVQAPIVGEETGDHSQLTQVDDSFAPERDPISELIELEQPPPAEQPDDEPDEELASEKRFDSEEDDDHTPLPPPQVHESGSFTKEAQQLTRGKTGSKSVQQRAEDALAGLDDDDPVADPPPPDGPKTIAKPALEAPGFSKADETDFVTRRGRVPGWVYGVVTIGALVVMFLLVWTRTDIFHPERAEQKRKEREAERLAKEAELRAQLKTGGEIVVEANEEGAAVWLRLGRTPLDTMPLPVYHPHQIRLELDGHAHQDVVVAASHWTGDRATLTATLSPAGPDHEVPAWPPKLPPAAKDGFDAVEGTGVVHIETQPPRAEAWLLVGYTNAVHMRDFEAGVKYEFKLTKDGFLPGFAVVEEDDWKLGGADPDALRGTVIEEVELVPAKPARGP